MNVQCSGMICLLSDILGSGVNGFLGNQFNERNDAALNLSAILILLFTPDCKYK